MSEEEKREFQERQNLPAIKRSVPEKGEKTRVYLGIDSGSTTTKLVLMDEEENIVDSFYAPNEGEPLLVGRNALMDIRNRWREAGAELEIIAAGTTGTANCFLQKLLKRNAIL